MDVVDCSPSKRWSSDTKMIWGGPIFSMSCGNGDEGAAMMMMIVGEDNSYVVENSPGCSPAANATILQPLWIFATPHACTIVVRLRWLRTTNSQWND